MPLRRLMFYAMRITHFSPHSLTPLDVFFAIFMRMRVNTGGL